MRDDTHHKSFEERVDEVLEKALEAKDNLRGAESAHDVRYAQEQYADARTALLAAHKEEVKRIIGEDNQVAEDPKNINFYLNELRHEQRTRANLTGKDQA